MTNLITLVLVGAVVSSLITSVGVMTSLTMEFNASLETPEVQENHAGQELTARLSLPAPRGDAIGDPKPNTK